MAINPSTQYPGKVGSTSPDYPYAPARNVAVAGDGTGTPWEAALVNDIFGLQQKMLTEASITPSGTPDSVTASQYFQAMQKNHGRVVATKAELQALDINFATSVALTSSGDGGFFTAVTGAAPGTYSEDSASFAGTIILPTGGDGSAAWLREFTGAMSVKWYGAVGGSDTQDTAAFKELALAINDRNGGIFYVPPTDNDYELRDDIVVWPFTTVIMDGMAKRVATDTPAFDAMFIPQPGATDVRFEKMLLDCNSEPGISGINVRRNNQRTTCGVVYVKNAAYDNTIGGGRGLIFEDGVTGGEAKLGVCDTLIVEDSYNGFGFNGGTGTGVGDKSNNTNMVGRILCRNVEVPVALFGNNPTYPHDGQAMSLIIDSVIGLSCGVVTTVSVPATPAIISSDRASNVRINDFYFFNTSAYVGGNSILLWAGEYKNCHVKGVIDSDIDVIVTDGDAANVCEDSTFDIQVNGVVATDLFTTSSAVAGHLANNNYHFSVNEVTTERMVPANINAMTTNFLSIQSKEHDCFVKGKTGTGGISTGFVLNNFAGHMGQLGTVLMSDVNGQPHELTCGTDGKLRIDGTIVGTQS